ncbi:unnamed protein product [Caenorhabditis brenneri]
MPPKGIRHRFAMKNKNMNEMNSELTTIAQKNTTPDDDYSQQSVQKSTKSLKRVRKSVGTFTSRENVPKRQKPVTDPKIELTITSSTTDDEDLDFGEEGLYPVKDGQLLKKRYKISKLLGVGGYATVHMAMNRKTKSDVALKIVRCGEWYNEVSDREIQIMKTIKNASRAGSDSESPIGASNVVSLLDNFRIKGEYGMHVVMVTEVLGPDLFSILVKSNQKVLSFDRIQRFSRNILNGLHFLHSNCGVMHLDLKPENIMVTVDHENMDLNDPKCLATVKIGDFGLTCYTTKDVTRTVQSCCYRSPEAFLKAHITPAADIWSFGCTLYEMATRELLFKCNDSENCCRVFHMDNISNLLGPIKRSLFKKDKENEWPLEQVFGEKKVLTGYPGSTNFICPEELRKRTLMNEHQAQACSDFLGKLMKIDPKKRLTAEQALKPSFFMERY